MIIIGFIATGGYWGYLYYRNKNFQAVSNWWTERGLDANPILSLLGLVVAVGLGVLIFIVVGLIGILIGNNDRIYSFTEKANKVSREAEIQIQSNQISETITLAQNEIQKKLSNLESAINQVQTGIENINSRMSSLISGISRLSDKISSFESFSETLYSDLKATQLTSSYIMAKAIEKASNKEYYKVDIMNY